MGVDLISQTSGFGVVARLRNTCRVGVGGSIRKGALIRGKMLCHLNMLSLSDISILWVFFTECVQHFHGKDVQVKRGKVVTSTTAAAECYRQIEIYISNAKTRLKRRPSDI